MDKCPEYDSRVAFRVIEGEAFIMTPHNGWLHSLNETGTRIWQLIEEKRSLKSILETICSEYDTDEDTAMKDLSAFIKELEEKGMVKT